MDVAPLQVNLSCRDIELAAENHSKWMKQNLGTILIGP